jgi:hypothetical protein
VKNWIGSDHTKDRPKYSDRCSHVIGYVFLLLFRPGVGLSADQGASAVDLMNREFAAHGQDARNALQLQLLESRELNAAAAGLAFLRGLADVDARKIAIVARVPDNPAS